MPTCDLCAKRIPHNVGQCEAEDTHYCAKCVTDDAHVCPNKRAVLSPDWSQANQGIGVVRIDKYVVWVDGHKMTPVNWEQEQRIRSLTTAQRWDLLHALSRVSGNNPYKGEPHLRENCEVRLAKDRRLEARKEWIKKHEQIINYWNDMT